MENNQYIKINLSREKFEPIMVFLLSDSEEAKDYLSTLIQTSSIHELENMLKELISNSIKDGEIEICILDGMEIKQTDKDALYLNFEDRLFYTFEELNKFLLLNKK